jgi:serine/threonine protein kinase
VVSLLEVLEKREGSGSQAVAVVLVLEYAQFGDLQTYLEAKRTNTFPHIRYMLLQILSGCEHLHSIGIIHRDLKTNNILVGLDDSIMIGDYGLSKFMRYPRDKMTIHIQTLHYRAPEVILGKKYYSVAVDYWSIGIIAYELVYKEVPYLADTEIGYLIEIFKHLGTPNFSKILDIESYTYVVNDFKVRFPKFAGDECAAQNFDPKKKVPKDIQAVIKGMLQVDPTKRMTCREAIQILSKLPTKPPNC